MNLKETAFFFLLEPALTEAEERHCISIICFLATDACNRAKIRMSGAFSRIMEIAKNTKCDVVLTMILIGLQSFKYDNISIDLMIKIGLINVLIERLDINTRDLNENHSKKIVSKRSANNSNKDANAGEEEEVRSNTPKRMKVDFNPPVISLVFFFYLCSTFFVLEFSIYK